MKPSRVLSAWLQDDAAQAATGVRNADHAEAVRASGRLAHFAAELDGIASRCGDEDAADHAMRKLLDDATWTRPLIQAALDAAMADPFFEPPFAPIGGGVHTGLVLLDHPLAVMTATIVTPASFAASRRVSGKRSIGFTGTRSLTRFVRSGGAQLIFYTADAAAGDFCAGAALPCRRKERRMIVDGEIVAIDGRTESFVIDATAGAIVMVAGELRARPCALAREFDSATLEFTGASAGEEACSRIQLMLTLLRVLGRADAGALFAATIAQAPFFLRWQATREYLALDAIAALPLLVAMASGDPHPEVRVAAQQTVAMLRVRQPGLFDQSCRAAAA